MDRGCCAICTEDIDVRACAACSVCRQELHQQCLEAVVREDSRCPLCRAELADAGYLLDGALVWPERRRREQDVSLAASELLSAELLEDLRSILRGLAEMHEASQRQKPQDTPQWVTCALTDLEALCSAEAMGDGIWHSEELLERVLQMVRRLPEMLTSASSTLRQAAERRRLRRRPATGDVAARRTSAGEQVRSRQRSVRKVTRSKGIASKR
eukprot:TRINITY_DN92222_c0_g1_i1.p1 TRINITY_DN92222_c0_g1~~TRINITY_DN92222_c0_g1_i1.p1  ORF type:complete len:220 (-),score=44.73 TRINITY_DN92222_c0_g1_i1:30-668(-)